MTGDKHDDNRGAHDETAGSHTPADTGAADATASIADDTVASPSTTATTVENPAVEWAAAPKRKRRKWPWIVTPAALLTAGLVVVSTVLIAPGVSAAGIPVGGMTRDGAEQAITDRVANTTITFEAPSGDVKVSAKDLGATIDARALADEAHSSSPLWNVGAWGSDKLKGAIKLDPAKASAKLQQILPGAFSSPVDASVAFNGKTFQPSESKDGQGVDIDALRDSLQTAIGKGKQSLTVSAKPVVVPPKVTTAQANAATDKLNAMTKDFGFYVGKERTVPVSAATAASWLSYSFEDGKLKITADESAIQKTLATVAKQVNRKPQDGEVITDPGGEVLDTKVEPLEGREVEDISSLAPKFAAQIEQGNGKLELPVKTVPANVKKLARNIDLNLSTQTVTVYENGKVVKSFLTSTGVGANKTTPGDFRVTAHVRIQDMGCVKGYEYCTKDVPWVMYWNWSDEGFHGTYWHNNFGTPMSHGCANLSMENAEWLYNWTPEGTPVKVHY